MMESSNERTTFFLFDNDGDDTDADDNEANDDGKGDEDDDGDDDCNDDFDDAGDDDPTTPPRTGIFNKAGFFKIIILAAITSL
mmetsp:Transcript_48134/g.53648  ORF Transcript_48134/g.53648 Transcript_48134/m.53648 type:complete len:83 (+) Transcript_48134:93-341(+)